MAYSVFANVNQIGLELKDYDSVEDFENEIKKAVMMLLNAGYITTVRYDDGKENGIVCIDFNYDDRSFGCHYPYWLSPEEYESVIWDNERDEDDDYGENDDFSFLEENHK